MDLQLYFDLIVYPTLQYILSQCRLEKITKEVALNIAHQTCDVDKVIMDYNKNLCPVMVSDAMKWFLSEIEEI